MKRKIAAIMAALRPEDATAGALLRKKKRPGAGLLVPALAVAVIVISAGVGGAYFCMRAAPRAPAVAAAPADPAPVAPPAPAAAPSAPAQKAAAAPPAPSALPQDEAFAPGSVPFVTDAQRAQIRNEYLSGSDSKALAIAVGRYVGYVTGQPNEELAKSVALDTCQKRVESAKATLKCDVYAVGNKVVYARARPPMPPVPYVAKDPLVERPFAAEEMPLVRDVAKANLAKNYVPARKSKTIALTPDGTYFYYFAHDSADEVVRRALEICGSNAGTPCMIIALDDNFVVPIPKTMKAVNFVRPATSSFVAAGERDFLARRYTGAPKGWSAVAASANSKTGAAFGAENEDTAVKSALAECAKSDRDCRIIAIGPFSVEPL